MGAKSGLNYGLTGIISLDSGSGSQLLNVDVFGFAAAMAANVVDITGPGANFAGKVYGSNVGGGGTATGKVQANQRPFPPTMRNVQGTLRCTLHTGCYVEFPVLISKLSVKKAKKLEDIWDVDIAWVKNGPETVTWAGSALSYSQPTLEANQVNAGSSLSSDPQDLAQGATVKYFLPTPASGSNQGYTAFATVAAVDAFVAAATPPREGLKPINSGFVRLDDAAGILLINWGFNDSKDNYELPNTFTFTDSHSLNSSASVAVINDVGALPAGFVSRGTTSRQVTNGTDGHQSTLNVTQGGLRTTVEDIEFPGTRTQVDPTGLTTSGVQTTVHPTSAPPADPTPPSGTKIVGKTTNLKLTSAGSGTAPQSYTVWQFGTKDAKDELELANTWVDEDPQGLGSSAAAAAVDGAPTLPAGYVERGTRTTTITGVDGHQLVIVHGGLSSTADDVVNNGSYTMRSSIEAFNRVTIEIVDGTASTEDLADVYWPAFQATAFAYRMTVRKLNPNKNVIMREFVDPGIGVNSDVYGLPERQEARVDSGNVQVYVTQALTRGSGKKWLRLGRSRRRRVVREFILSRLLSGTTAPDHQDLVGTVNNSTFLGLPEGEVMYMSGRMRTNIGLTGTYNFYMDYRFLWIEGGHYALTGWAEEGLMTTASVSPGWVDVSSLTGSNLVAATPDEADFSPFLA